MAIIITYDLSGQQGPVKETMKGNGYSATFYAVDNSVKPPKRTLVNLPETTLYHNTKTVTQGQNDLLAAAKEHNVTVKRCVSNEIGGPSWTYIPGQPL